MTGTAAADYVTFDVSDGSEMRAYVARPAGAPKAGMIVLQEAFGVNAHIRDVAQRYAREGYLAIAPELFHRTGPGFEGSYDDFNAVAPHFGGLTDAGMTADLQATHEWLKSGGQSKVCAIGYCLGGRVATLAAITLPIACGVSYYGPIAPSQFFPGLLDRFTDLRAPMLFFWGGLDKHIGPEQRRAVADAASAAGRKYGMAVFSYADHGFNCDARPSYNAEAAAEAWALTRVFLDHQLAA